MSSQLDLRDLDRAHEPDPAFVARLRLRLEAAATETIDVPELEQPAEVAVDPVAEPASRQRRRLVLAGAAAIIVLAGVGGALWSRWDDSDSTTFVGEPPALVLGNWVSVDIDGSPQTMEILGSGGTEFQIVVHDTAALVCSGAPSTLTGIGQLRTGGSLVVAAPVLQCDDGTQPKAASGPPLEQVLADLTFVHDAATGELADSLGVRWRRPGWAPSPGPTTPNLAPLTAQPLTSGGMWPQSNIEEVREAQDLVDAGDPAYTWQVDPQLASDAGWAHLDDLRAEIVERFLREELGWEEFVFDVFQEQRSPVDSSGTEGFHRGVVYLRCAPGQTNPLYPVGDDQPAEARCAPTIDELQYETVSLDLVQPDRRGSDGIWVVNAWRMISPFTQSDPRAVEAEATAHLEGFLRARVAGEGAEGYVFNDVPLMYATATGAPYERFEIDRVSEPRWPFAAMDFIVRLIADDGQTVVEQPIFLQHDGFVEGDGLPSRATLSYWHTASETTQDGQSVPVPYQFLDGTVTASAAAPWSKSQHFENAIAPDDQALERVALTTGPVQISCRPTSPAADAAALAASIESDPDVVATAPAEVRIGGIAGLQMDLTLAPGASACPDPRKGNEPLPEDRVRGTGFPLEQASRMRLYLLDVPEGSATRILAIAVVAPDARFDAVVEVAGPIVESIESLGTVDLSMGGVLPEDFREFLAGEFGVAVEDTGELAGSLDALDEVEDEITLQRFNWSEDAEIRAYLVRRSDAAGHIGTDQWPVGAAVWVVDVNHAGVPRVLFGEEPLVADRVVHVYDAETGESLAYFESRAT